VTTEAIRERTKKRVEELGYASNPYLPVLDQCTIRRSGSEITGRMLALHACIASSCGFPKDKACEWLKRENLTPYMSDRESKYLNSMTEEQRTDIQWHVEALWALAWAGGYHDMLNFNTACSDSLVTLFPDLKRNDSSDAFIANFALRPTEELSEILDLAYCLHWAIREEQLTGKRQTPVTKIPDQVIVERRRALEWLTSEEDWDYVTLDT
jgi:hypothetical protein